MNDQSHKKPSISLSVAGNEFPEDQKTPILQGFIAAKPKTLTLQAGNIRMVLL
jgi:hypothetical protein